MTTPDHNAVADALLELEAARRRLYVLCSALNHGEIDCASAEVVACDVDDAVARALDRLDGGHRHD